jgi:hypothetical protein
MSRHSFDAQGLQFAWDGTSIELASTCLRKYYYRMIASIAPADTSVHLIFGGIYASALERFYHLRAEGADLDTALRAVVRYALEASWPADSPQPLNFDHSAKTRPNLIRTLVWYIDQFGEESDNGIKTHHLANGRPAVELSFTVELDDDLFFSGHLDRVVNYGGDLYWMDQKTTGATIGMHWFDSMRMTNQFFGYTWAGQIVLHSPVKGGIVDGAQIATGFSRFSRGFVTYNADHLAEWLDSARYHIAAARSATALRTFPMNLSSCDKYGGCPYKTLCSRAPSIRDRFLEGDYKEIEPWDPLKAR